MPSLVDRLHASRALGRIFHTLDFCLAEELRGCSSVLDLGCGPKSPLKHCQNVQYSVGVEAFAPYLAASQAQHIHTEYLLKPIEGVSFPRKSFDAVIMVEVLEHLPAEVGLAVLRRAEGWARKKIIVTSPNGFLPQKALDGNPHQEHRSGWDVGTLQQLGFSVHGLAGLKALRREAPHDTMETDLLAPIRFRPRLFWFAVATASQLVTHRLLPQHAFELFCVKTVGSTPGGDG